MLPSNRITARDVDGHAQGRADAGRAREAAEALGAVMKLTDVIRRPLVTEKTTILREDGRTVVFEVAQRRQQDRDQARRREAPRRQGRRRADGQRARKDQAQGRFVGRRSDWKKAYVRLRDGEKLPDFLRARRQGSETSMPIRKYKPTSPGRRPDAVQTYDEITTDEPYRPLTETLKQSGGRNNTGEVTIWWRGGGHKRLYRIIDFKRDKNGHSRHGLDDRVRPEPLGAHRAGDLRGRREALHPAAAGPQGRRHDDLGRRGRHPAGQALPLKNIPLGTQVHNIELKPGKGGQMARSAGAAVQVVAKEGDYVSVKMPSGEIRKVTVDCLATIGQVGNLDHENVSIGKAGRTRWMGKRRTFAAWR